MKLNKKMGTSEMLITMAEGNQEALNCLVKLVQTRYGILDLILLDTLEIYGETIETLWTSCCNKNMPKLLTLLREFRHGNFSKDEIRKNILKGRFK